MRQQKKASLHKNLASVGCRVSAGTGFYRLLLLINRLIDVVLNVNTDLEAQIYWY